MDIILENLRQLDWYLFKLIHQEFTNTVFDAFFPFITDMHKVWFVQLIFAGIVFLWFKLEKQRALKILLVLAVTAGLSDLIAFHGFKKKIKRLRPYYHKELVQEVKVDSGHRSYSMPSNHATNTMAIMTVLTGVYPAGSLFFVLYALIISYSRVYVGVHFVSDVLVGMLLGYLIGKTILYLVKKTPLLEKATESKIVQRSSRR